MNRTLFLTLILALTTQTSGDPRTRSEETIAIELESHDMCAAAIELALQRCKSTCGDAGIASFSGGNCGVGTNCECRVSAPPIE